MRTFVAAIALAVGVTAAQQQPVPFESRVPSFYALSYVHAEGKMHGPGARAIGARLRAQHVDCLPARLDPLPSHFFLEG